MELILKVNETIRTNYPWSKLIFVCVLAVLCAELHVNVLMSDKMYNHIAYEGNVADTDNKGAVAAEVAETVLTDIRQYSYNLGIKGSVKLENMALEDNTDEGVKSVEMSAVESAPAEASAEKTMPAEVITKEPAANETITEIVPEVVPAVPSPQLTVILEGNGGVLKVSEVTCDADEFDLASIEEPKRLGKVFDGWYLDPECVNPFTGVADGTEELKLYAGWKDIPGFLTNDKGHIVGYTDSSIVVVDGLMIFTNCESCVGVENGAFDGLEFEILEVYIPANISYIEEGLLESLPYLMYIEAAPGNSTYYSKGGVLYYHSGEIAAMPGGW